MKAPEKRLPDLFPEPWASDWGQDVYGVWMALTFRGVRQLFRWICPGTFMMGSPKNEPERQDRERLHRVKLTRGFWLADTVCTQALWEAVAGEIPSHFKGEGRPVESVSWEDVMEMIDRFNSLVPGLDLRLPTEAEWEYACRAGTNTPFSFGQTLSTDQVNYNGNFPYAGGRKGEYRKETVPVGTLAANPWGLYEMHGNVYEWCSDWYGDYPEGPVESPQGPQAGKNRVLRGGSWNYFARDVRSASRSYHSPDSRNRLIGFRLARGQSGRSRQAG